MQGNLSLIPSLIVLLVGISIGYLVRLIYAKNKLVSSELKAEKILKEAKEEAQRIIARAESETKDMLLEAKESIIKEKKEYEKELKQKQFDLANYEKRILRKEELVDKKIEIIEQREQALNEKENILNTKNIEIEKKLQSLEREIEKIAGLTKEEAKIIIEEKAKKEIELQLVDYYDKMIEEVEYKAEKEARNIIISVMERLAPEVSKEVNITNITLPDDEMKGRIIGREGRNIRALENILGVDIIIDDTPEIVTISGFDPIRREMAKMTLLRLIKDGRIHPARIEEVYDKVKLEIEQKIIEEGNKACYDLGVNNVPGEIIKYLGRLYFRTSYGQNVLSHSKEVAKIAALIAGEIGANVEIAKKAGLYHDIGKVIHSEEGNKHVEEGIKLLRAVKESEAVIEAVANHHENSSFIADNVYKRNKNESIEAIIVRIADAISASRPGARFNEGAWEDYIRRIEELENEAKSFPEVEKAFAIQAGREIRVFVKMDVPEENIENIAKNLKAKIQLNKNIKYPGRIKITVIKESRIVEYTD
ncbi:MAG: ribonuclease Y [Spirochaetes bacterium]|nr:ribonuclease Y [Spirochaetota bacterium]